MYNPEGHEMVHVWKSHTGEDEACTLLQIQTQSRLQSKTLFQTNKAQGNFFFLKKRGLGGGGKRRRKRNATLTFVPGLGGGGQPME